MSRGPRRLLAAGAALAAFTACARSGEPAAEVTELYRLHCARCHGEDGRGDPRSRGLNPNLDLTRGLMVARRDRGQLYRRIAYGYGPMPAFAHKLDEQEIEALAKYVVELAEQR